MEHDRHPNKDKKLLECADVGSYCEPTVQVWAQPPLGVAGLYCEKCFKFFPAAAKGGSHE